MEDKNPEFDLTTESGLSLAMEWFDKYGWTIYPIAWILRNLYKMASAKDSLRKQVEIATKLIRNGKEMGLKSIKITMTHEAGISLGTVIDGIPIELKVGSNGSCCIEVFY